MLHAGSPGAANLTKWPLLPAALGTDGAEMGKTMPVLACKELEPCPSGLLTGCFLNSWGFYTVTCCSNFLCFLFFLYSREGNVLPWSAHSAWSHNCSLWVLCVDEGIHICPEKYKWMCLIHGWRCIWKTKLEHQNLLHLGILIWQREKLCCMSEMVCPAGILKMAFLYC